MEDPGMYSDSNFYASSIYSFVRLFVQPANLLRLKQKLRVAGVYV